MTVAAPGNCDASVLCVQLLLRARCDAAREIRRAGSDGCRAARRALAGALRRHAGRGRPCVARSRSFPAQWFSRCSTSRSSGRNANWKAAKSSFSSSLPWIRARSCKGITWPFASRSRTTRGRRWIAGSRPPAAVSRVISRPRTGVLWPHWTRLPSRRIVAWTTGTPLAPNEVLLRYRVRGGQVKFATNAFFFQEGTAKRYEGARYGEFRVAPDGELLLTGLRGKELQPL